MSIDYNRALMLLSVVEKAIAHGPAFSAIINEAGVELAVMNNTAQQDAAIRAKRTADTMARAAAVEAAQQAKLAAEALAKSDDGLKADALATAKAAAPGLGSTITPPPATQPLVTPIERPI